MSALGVLLGRRHPLRRRRQGSAGTRRTVTFPTTRLVSRVQIALGADLSADPLTWNWLDITEWVRHDLGISLTVGRRDEASTVTTGRATLKLDNRDGRFSRRNPNSPYYGLLSKNTPIWATVDAGSGEKTRLEMFVNEWPTRWTDKSATDSTVTIQCAGVLRRLQQGQVFRSAWQRTVSSSPPVAYWPLTEPSGATTFGSGIPSGSAVAIAEIVALGEVDGPVASSSYPDFRQLVSTSQSFPTPISGDFTIDMIVNVPSAAALPLFDVLLTGTLPSVSLAGTDFKDSQWHQLRLSIFQSGGDIAFALYKDGVLSSSGTAAASQTLGGVSEIRLGPQPALTTEVYSFGEVTAWDSDTLAVSPTDAFGAVFGYTGEQAHERMTRLAGEEGVLFATTAATSAAMGPQSVAKFIDLLRECEAADGGVLYETRWGLAYKSRSEYYNQPAGLALDFEQGHIGDLPEPADDDQRLRNKWTVARVDGSEATVEEETGPMGTGTEGPGVYDDSVTLNVETDDQLIQQASWRVHLGTVDEDRWPRIDLNFTRTPALIPDWTALPYGARVTADNPPEQMPPDPLDLIVEGHTERWDDVTWRASLNCSPASVHRVVVVGSTDGNLGRVDAANSTLAADATSDATTISVASTGALWRTGSVNFDINVAGERMTVTNISGGSSPQTFTVTRSVNGVVKAQSATVGGIATKVGLWMPAVYAL